MANIMDKKEFKIKKSSKGVVIVPNKKISGRRRNASTQRLAIECFDEEQVQRIMSIQEVNALKIRHSKFTKVIGVLKNNAIVSVVKEIKLSKY